VDDPSPAGARDAAIVALMALTGMRRGEVVALDLDDYKREGENGEGVLIIRGKGNVERKGYVFSGAATALARWLSLRGENPGPLFIAINKGGILQHGHRLTPRALQKMLRKRVDQAGLENMTWHDFRRTFAGNLLDTGVDLVTVQHLLGHSSPLTTSQYDRREDRVRRGAAHKLFLPYPIREVHSDS
jgi:integrase